MIERIKVLYQRSPSHLLLAAAALHLILTACIYISGRLAISPAINQDGLVTSIAPDSLIYLQEARTAAEILSQKGVSAWLANPSTLHVKLYSLSLALLGPLLGANILSAEPVNALCYVAILFLTFKIGEEAFDRRVGLMGATALALWPSFLLHTTQLLKDPLFIAVMLLLSLIITCWLTRSLSLANGLKTGLAAGAAAYSIGLIRSGVWGGIVLITLLIGALFLLIRQVREKQFLAGNVISVVAALSITGLILLSNWKNFQSSHPVVRPVSAESPSVETGPANSEAPGREISSSKPDHAVGVSLKERLDDALMRLTYMRQDFIRLNPGSGSNMDGEVVFKSLMDVVRYLPRAAEIGFMAPFPNQWFGGAKQVGNAVRLMSGFEMLAIYAIELLALAGLWHSRSQLPAWLLFCVVATGVTALALVVINVGALYRMRYAFFILMLLLGMKGLLQIFSSLRHPALPVNCSTAL